MYFYKTIFYIQNSESTTQFAEKSSRTSFQTTTISQWKSGKKSTFTLNVEHSKKDEIVTILFSGPGMKQEEMVTINLKVNLKICRKTAHGKKFYRQVW